MKFASQSVALLGAVALAMLVDNCSSQHLPLPALPYAYDALEPVISKDILRVHHLGHHQSYTNKLNAALLELRAAPETNKLAKSGIDNVIGRLDEIEDAELRIAIGNNLGGYLNHELFWSVMAPVGEGGKPSQALEVALTGSFGSVEEFQRQFSVAAGKVFGSGYAWLSVNDVGTLAITTTSNQDTPANNPLWKPIMTLDVWEHAYYLQYKNKRNDFIQAWWSVVNWNEVSRRYAAAVGVAPDSATEL